MHVHFSYHHVSRNTQLDHAVSSHVEKLEKLLIRFSPDLVHLRGILEFNSPRHEAVCSLNLWLPTARIHARESGGSVLVVLQASFNEVLEQVKRHKRVLRREGVWKRRRFKFLQEEKKIQAGELHVTDRQEMRDYLDQVRPQLEHFIARELRYLQLAGALMPGQLQIEEVVNEVVARSLENVNADYSESVPFHRLVSESIRVLDGMLGQPASANSAPPHAASAEPVVSPAPATSWPTPNNSGEGEPARNDSVELSLVETMLASLPASERHVYVLHALEGFSWEETAQVLGRPADELQEMFRQVSREVSETLRQGEGKVTTQPRNVQA